jgi:hypothetical protein
MAAAALTPRVRMMTLCDGVRESKTEAGVFHLKGSRQGISAGSFPFFREPLWIFLLLSSPHNGEYPCNLRIVNGHTEKSVYYSHVNPRPTFAAEGEWWAYYAPIRCTFPEPGWHRVELSFFQAQGKDIVKGEIPFLVAADGD